jgi:ABC-type transporter lipoprotein component MlaA
MRNAVQREKIPLPLPNMKSKRSLLIAALSYLVLESAPAQSLSHPETNAPPRSVLQGAAEESVVLPQGFNDPIEPFNRAMWAFNKGFMTAAVRPFSRGYRFVVVKPVRTGIANMGKNLTYPGRLVNNLFQGNWTGMGAETARCLCNTVLGLGGFFDLATKWDIPRSDENFGQTFKKWGWNPSFYLMLPLLGPSDDGTVSA